MPVEEIHANQLSKEARAATVGDTPENRRLALSGYFAAIAEMDRNIGRLLDWLEENGLRENTLVVFNSDNGMNMGHHGIWGKGNGTYPPNMFDTAVKVPTLISRPGHVPQDLVCDKLLSQYDFMPTLLGYLGLETSSDQPLPGRDFSPVLRGESMSGDTPVFVFDEYGPTRMIRTGAWKYVHRYAGGPHELYDLVNDPLETRNLVNDDRYQSRVSTLRTELDTWFERYVDPRMDGAGNNVTGRGQIGLAGSEDYDKPFADDVEVESVGDVLVVTVPEQQASPTLTRAGPTSARAHRLSRWLATRFASSSSRKGSSAWTSLPVAPLTRRSRSPLNVGPDLQIAPASPVTWTR